MNENGYSATYSPEDNKLRLYVGRVPRDEYEKLRAEGWVSTPKQNCNFVATWTPTRRDTALEYAGIIEDEDMGPDERAADRAERFGGYRDKRTYEATGHADRYDAGPTAHGYQSEARAERAASRHDRVAARAVDAWGKAEYWVRRTAGVIDHALYKSSPSVRMGRIKVLEAELRAKVATYEKAAKLFDIAVKLRDITDPDEQTRRVLAFFGSVSSYREYPHPDAPEEKRSVYSLMTSTHFRPITGREALELYLSDRTRPDVANNDWANHYKFRLAYENQMLEAQGGRLAHVEIEAGGKIGSKLIIKVNKSTATGRVTSVDLLGPKVTGWTYRAANIPGTEYAAHSFDTERMPPDAYKPPTPETLAELEAFRTARKAAQPEKAPCPLINPTDADAERLQALINDHYCKDEPRTLERITQAVYSANSGGNYAAFEALPLTGGGFTVSSSYMSERKDFFPSVCKVRMHGKRVLILTDKPQKPFPPALWHDPRPQLRNAVLARTPELQAALRCNSSSDWTAEQRALIEDAVSVGFVHWASVSQFSITEKWAKLKVTA